MSQTRFNALASQGIPVKNMNQLMTLANSPTSHLHSLRDDAWVLPEVQKLIEEKIDIPYPNPLIDIYSAQYGNKDDADEECVFSVQEKQIIWNTLCEALVLISQYEATKKSHDLVKSLKHFRYYTITSLTKIGDYMIRYDIEPNINDFIAIHSQV